MLLEELKAKAYDTLVLIEQAKVRLQEITAQILKEQKKIEAVEKDITVELAKE